MNVTVAEARYARFFLVRAHARITPAMIRAVTAWFRQESGYLSRVIGCNAFNIQPGAATYLSTGIGPNGFLVFPDLETGFLAAAVVLIELAPSYGYGTVLAAARRPDALAFLAALARSSWSASHYGWVPGANARGLTNHLVSVYVKLNLTFKVA